MSSTTRGLFLAMLLAIALLFTACGGGQATPPITDTTGSMTLTTPDFPNGGGIPAMYTCDGENISPVLSWSGAPAATRSLAVTVEDPDAPNGIFVHWVVWGLSPDATSLGPTRVVTARVEGKNSAGNFGYTGPCPPAGNPHRYFFKIYALDADLDLKPGATASDLYRAMDGHLLAVGQTMGTYQRMAQ